MCCTVLARDEVIGEKGSEGKTEKGNMTRAESELLSSMRFELTTYFFLLLSFLL